MATDGVPCVPVNEIKLVGLADSDGGGNTVPLTGTVAVTPVAAFVIVPVYVPIAAPIKRTVMVLLTVPLVGVTIVVLANVVPSRLSSYPVGAETETVPEIFIPVSA